MICPNCQTDVVVTEQQIGALYTCGSCQAVYFIGFDGKPEFGEVLTEVPTADLAEAPMQDLNASSAYEGSLEPLVDSVDMLDFDNKLENQFASLETPAQANARQDSSFSDVANEISAYGNTEVQLAGMNYDLKVVGIDTQETAMLFKEAIEDLKFGWDANEVIKGLKNGQIEFKRLSPVKAYILAKRLQFLDIEKHWKQNVLS
jgi:hypothetical protein